MYMRRKYKRVEFILFNCVKAVDTFSCLNLPCISSDRAIYKVIDPLLSHQDYFTRYVLYVC